jgi:hypothetical protein
MIAKRHGDQEDSGTAQLSENAPRLGLLRCSKTAALHGTRATHLDPGMRGCVHASGAEEHAECSRRNRSRQRRLKRVNYSYS